MGQFDVTNICMFQNRVLSQNYIAYSLEYSRRGSIIRIICDMNVYTKSCCICRNFVAKATQLGLRSNDGIITRRLGTKQVETRRENQNLRVKSSLRGSNTRVSGLLILKAGNMTTLSWKNHSGCLVTLIGLLRYVSEREFEDLQLSS